MQTISVVNHASVDLGISLDRLVTLGNDYLKKIVMPIWPGPQTTLVASKQILPKSQAIVLLDDADQDGALGYHDVTPDGYPLTKVFVRTAMADGAAVTEVFTHELAEMYVDPDCNLSAADAQGRIYALEVCDAVEADGFALDGHPVSNIVTKAWFEPFHKPGTVRLDYLGTLKQPFELRPGGYISVMDAGAWSQLHGSPERALTARRPVSNRPSLRRDRQRFAQTPQYGQYLKAQGRPTRTAVSSEPK